MRATLLTLTLACLTIASLAGCVGDDPAPHAPADPAPVDEDPVVATDGGAKRASQLSADDTVQAPEWQVGDWFGHHVYIQGRDPAGRHYNTVVVEATDAGWLLAADNVDVAKEEAAWDLPVAGFVTKDLQTTAYGVPWNIFAFPLKDGKQWRATMDVLDMSSYTVYTFDVSFTTKFAEAIDVNGQRYPGFRITATTGDGDLLVDASYIPAIQWYGHIQILDVRTDAPDDLFLKTVSMGHGTSWTGTYHIAERTASLTHFGGFVAFVPTMMAPRAPETFTVPDSDVLYGIVFSFGWTSASATLVIGPDGTARHTKAAHVGADQEGDVEAWFVDEPAIPGEWRIATLGAGPLWVAGAELYALRLLEATL